MRRIEDNPWEGTIEFIHQKQGVVVKRCDIKELPHPLPPEYSIAIPPKNFSASWVERDAPPGPPTWRRAVYRLHKNGQGRPAYWFDRVEPEQTEGAHEP